MLDGKANTSFDNILNVIIFVSRRKMEVQICGALYFFYDLGQWFDVNIRYKDLLI
jgi:hypothetical protein